ncbi:hypothetical protein ACF3MZ_18860 [Paenibacillaceae bacterium WGS1546]|uniref:hypothetical protein n=1 Tax=Cohnella sp. WGS1546 TaxID=3366810 RepID=UPI00372D1380
MPGFGGVALNKRIWETKFSALISPKQVEVCFIEWMKEVMENREGDIISLDGKTMRGTGSQTSGQKAIHVVSAYSTDYS